MPSELNVNKISPASGTEVSLGDSGDTITIPSGVTLAGDGSNLTGVAPNKAAVEALGIELPAANLTGTVAGARLPDPLPAIDGSNLTGVSGGKVLQVVQTVKTDTTTATTSSLADISGMSVSITPSATSSKVLISFTINASNNDNTGAIVTLLRGTTEIIKGDTDGIRTVGTVNVWNDHAKSTASCAMQYLDSPSTTSSTTYKLQWKVANASTITLNRGITSGNDNGAILLASTITAIEIGA